MSGFVRLEREDTVARLTLQRGKVNAIDDELVEELRHVLARVKRDAEARAVVLGGSGPFFSFGFDIPKFLDYSRQQFTAFLEAFTELYTYLFTYPKPVVAAVNGHAVAGGCMLALACDRRVMAEGGAKIALNELGFGATVPAGSVEMLRFAAGDRNAAEVLYSAAMFTAERALSLKLVDEVAPAEKVQHEALRLARALGKQPARAFASIKAQLRGMVADEMRRREPASIAEFVDIWYSEETWETLQTITIR